MPNWTANDKNGKPGNIGGIGVAKKVVLHESITLDRVMEAAESEMFGVENPGFCKACGEDADGCEPDARGYECECCGELEVSGASELLICGEYHE
jgi:hypothetical protein